jgi:hypothetical protein
MTTQAATLTSQAVKLPSRTPNLTTLTVRMTSGTVKPLTIAVSLMTKAIKPTTKTPKSPQNVAKTVVFTVLDGFPIQKRWRATAVQDAGALAEDERTTRSVLECASPLALWRVTELNAKSPRRQGSEARRAGIFVEPRFHNGQSSVRSEICLVASVCDRRTTLTERRYKMTMPPRRG